MKLFYLIPFISTICALELQERDLCDGYSEMSFCHGTNFKNCKTIGVNTGCWQRSPSEFDHSLYSIKVHGGWDRCAVAENPDGSGQSYCVDNQGWGNVAKWPSMKGMWCCNGCSTLC